ncbi:MAG TPA: hypothetical protein PLY93_02845 [Turneriella sp.]|nr:hypothetical protein [Turneriella sp.]
MVQFILNPTYGAVLIALNALFFFYALFKKNSLRTYLLFFVATTTVELLFVSKILPVESAEVEATVAYIFTLTSDLRFILILAFLLYAQKNISDLGSLHITGDVLKPAFIFTLFPTLIVTALGFLKPHWINQGGNRYLAYEIAFTVLTLLWVFVVLPQKTIGTAEKFLMKKAALPVLAYYGLAVMADLGVMHDPHKQQLIKILSALTRYGIFLPWLVVQQKVIEKRSA